MDFTDAYEYFYEALKYSLKHGSHKSQKSIAIAAGCTDALISIALNKESKKRPGFNAQQSIANACGYSYPSFLELGRKIKEEIVDGITKKNGYKDTVGNVYELPVKYKPPPHADNRLAKMHEILEKAFNIL